MAIIYSIDVKPCRVQFPKGEKLRAEVMDRDFICASGECSPKNGLGGSPRDTENPHSTISTQARSVRQAEY